MLHDTLDHLVVAGRDLDEMHRVVQAWGVTPAAGGRHRSGETANRLVGLEPGYLELVGPTPGTPPHDGMSFGLAELHQPVLRTWAATVPDPDAAIAAARRAGCDLGPFREGRRTRSDGTELVWRLTDPRADRLGGTVPFLIDWGDTPHPSTDLPVELQLDSLTFTHPQPERVRAVHDALGLPRLPVVTGPAGLQAVLTTPNGPMVITSNGLQQAPTPSRPPTATN